MSPDTRRAAPARQIIGRERNGSQITDRLSCGHTITTRYTGWQTHRRCTRCALQQGAR